MKRYGKLEVERLKNVIENDRISNIDKMSQLIKSDVKKTLENYLILDDSDVFLGIKNNEFGIEITIKCLAKSTKECGDFTK